ncbi:hypothetical protein [Lysobacter gummosus]|uniref:hypothetical protein n=1 Tax=Lysobacter gummosus TaxID=262324 RepID=UPI00362B5508
MRCDCALITHGFAAMRQSCARSGGMRRAVISISHGCFCVQLLFRVVRGSISQNSLLAQPALRHEVRVMTARRL